jgi:hypothetical protein
LAGTKNRKEEEREELAERKKSIGERRLAQAFYVLIWKMYLGFGDFVIYCTLLITLDVLRL